MTIRLQSTDPDRQNNNEGSIRDKWIFFQKKKHNRLYGWTGSRWEQGEWVGEENGGESMGRDLIIHLRESLWTLGMSESIKVWSS